MPDGESCAGKWSSAAGAGINVGTDGLIGTYRSIYVVGTSVNTGTGQNPGQAFLTYSQGRTFQVEFVTGAGTASGFGIANDNNESPRVLWTPTSFMKYLYSYSTDESISL